jgi:hypothetical protein
MSFNRTKYDNCGYAEDLSQSTSSLYYLLDPVKYTNCNKCFMTGQIIGGPAVSHTNQNLVDLESRLWNIDRVYSRCSKHQFLPNIDNSSNNGANGAWGDGIELPKHLRQCNFVKTTKPTKTGIRNDYPSCNTMKSNNNTTQSYFKKDYANF